MRVGILLTFAFVGGVQAQVPTCFPGLHCDEEHKAEIPLVGSAIRGLTATPNLVIDRTNGLVWSRELYALGTTKDRLTAAYAGTESYSTAIERAETDAHAQIIDGIEGWRIAKPSEVEDLIARLKPPALYMYFKTHHFIQGPDDVIGIVRSEPVNGPIPSMGVQHANFIHGPYGTSGHTGAGLAEINNYGIWLVQKLTPEISNRAALAMEVKEYFEPVEEMSFDPLETYEVEKKGDSVTVSASKPISPLVNATGGVETRFVALYGLKAAPRGAVVDAALAMEGVQSMGAPVPLLRVSMLVSTGAPLTMPAELWKCDKSVAIGVWQFPNAAQLSLPNPELRNAYSGGANFYGCFTVEYNSLSFQIPRLTVRFIREDNLLTRRPKP